MASGVPYGVYKFQVITWSEPKVTNFRKQACYKAKDLIFTCIQEKHKTQILTQFKRNCLRFRNQVSSIVSTSITLLDAPDWILRISKNKRAVWQKAKLFTCVNNAQKNQISLKFKYKL